MGEGPGANFGKTSIDFHNIRIERDRSAGSA
jgi:hypothetical protein